MAPKPSRSTRAGEGRTVWDMWGPSRKRSGIRGEDLDRREAVRGSQSTPSPRLIRPCCVPPAARRR
ncbi:hypothetical protein ACFFX0_16055 [Citricoccus parietis]|uniref:Uncharacterized protein n=1 Tax=Citricoccus parietis TaxID=592307 RepID=A0ABV5G124_9MICC